MEIHLYINFYTDKNIERQKELDYCVNVNSTLNDIECVHIIMDDLTKYKYLEQLYPKVKLHLLQTRPMFYDFFSLANKESGNPRCINILSNTDIFFDSSLSLLKSFQWNNHVLCLSRQDLMYEKSQDTWIWQGKLNIPQHSKFYLGILGCDSVIANSFRETGYTIANPCFSILCHHVHKSQIRNYNSDYVPGTFAFVKPCYLYELMNEHSIRFSSPYIHNDTQITIGIDLTLFYIFIATVVAMILYFIFRR